MLSIENRTSSPLTVRLEDFEGIDPEEIALALQSGQAGDLGDLDNGVTVVIEGGG